MLAKDFTGSSGAGRFASKLAPTAARYTPAQFWLWLWLWLLKTSRETAAHSEPPLSGGLVEAEFQGLSDMDVARATMGQGWPVVACP